MLFGIDQSFRSCAISVIDDEQCGGFDFALIRMDADETIPKGVVDKVMLSKSILEQLCGFIEKHKKGDFLIGIEGVAFSAKGNMTRDLAGLQSVIISGLCDRYGRERIRVLDAKSIKKMALKGNAKKEELFDVLPVDVKEKVGKILKSKGRYDVTDSFYIAKGASILESC